eukprot:9228845-Lingulodinium_polyedra.AAC.1
MASMTRGGKPSMANSWPRQVVVTGKRRRAARAAGSTDMPTMRSHRWVETESPAAWPAARR